MLFILGLLICFLLGGAEPKIYSLFGFEIVFDLIVLFWDCLLSIFPIVFSNLLI
jgi:hypothetical protein